MGSSNLVPFYNNLSSTYILQISHSTGHNLAANMYYLNYSIHDLEFMYTAAW